MQKLLIIFSAKGFTAFGFMSTVRLNESSTMDFVKPTMLGQAQVTVRRCFRREIKEKLDGVDLSFNENTLCHITATILCFQLCRNLVKSSFPVMLIKFSLFYCFV